ncbi:hypothetical protein KP2612_003888 [Komagataella phaffii]|uniref:Alpha-1,2-mannosyltransferase, responsible for addition of the first alpha-1,2-linked mannose n=1 Tax=Komagataella phaffii (strain GS115 / ATCC 20864) TaxID=644223 RepID=C4R4C8_KOMPG|nr:Alpha-1,2-mannosyltransferase, responsible for addition of the first alpha-1,2-linked mannose [Komagataella phaffii GS115]AOA63794.1 GQ67_03434T0 [Komagataella phaffii]AOA69194.1 GQ68_03403T0 [Komagataella phaffii GS115]CAH2449835.1 Alpha-1,2-mannosyltransferase, responsible for addition of the first alpha-1,2-linked mannose [Komagataella phaffii CBS 7435]CAY70414.1 Alpha-1,2-mannosyltransferase, responsible for addition of the first alpha-1,2-linked mannose [Komagataella phaffii GS115]
MFGKRRQVRKLLIWVVLLLIVYFFGLQFRAKNSAHQSSIRSFYADNKEFFDRQYSRYDEYDIIDNMNSHNELLQEQFRNGKLAAGLRGVAEEPNSDEVTDDTAIEEDEQAAMINFPKRSPQREKSLVELRKFYKNVLSIIINNKPAMPIENPRDPTPNENALKRKFGKSGIINIALHDTDPSLPILSEAYLRDSLQLSPSFIASLSKSHSAVVKAFPPSFPANAYNGTGIVFIGGQKFSWLSLLSIENLRKTGSKVPVELIIPFAHEYEPQLCEEILPKLNATCVLLQETVGIDLLKSGHLKGYQFKSLALLASSFEQVLLVDSDNIIVENPDPIFDSEVFQRTGLVLWPDFWRRVTHPDYYKIAGIKLGSERVRHVVDSYTDPSLYTSSSEDPFTDIPLHDREGAIPDGSTESGQILISKTKHCQTILLSLYYNFFGPDYYYPLFTQGASGEGDKETFLAAANYYKLPFYNIKKGVDVIGYWKPDQSAYQGCGMLQYDPIVDYQNLQTFLKTHKGSRVNKLEQSELDKPGLLSRLIPKFFFRKTFDEHQLQSHFTKDRSKIMFIHSNFPKLDPFGLKLHNYLFVDQDTHKPRIRMYADQTGLSFDFELRQWIIIHEYFCEYPDFNLKYLENANVKPQDLCMFIKEELNFLQNNPIQLT